MEDLEEAGNEIMLLDDEEVPYVIGECFVYLPKEQVEEKLEQGEWDTCRARVNESSLAQHYSCSAPAIEALQRDECGHNVGQTNADMKELS